MAGRPREFDDQLVIQAAMDAFWRNGFEATSAQELVDSTGLGRGSLYAAFGSKENLYHEALRRYHRSSIEFHEEVFRQPGSVKDRLRILLEKGIELDFSDIERNGCMAIFSPLERAAKDKTVEGLSRSYIKELEGMFVALFLPVLRPESLKGAVRLSRWRKHSCVPTLASGCLAGSCMNLNINSMRLKRLSAVFSKRPEGLFI